MDVQVNVIKKKLSTVKEDKAAGDDNVSPRILKAISDKVAYPVAMIFRKSLDTGCVPRDWRTADVSHRYLRRAEDTMQATASPGRYAKW